MPKSHPEGAQPAYISLPTFAKTLYTDNSEELTELNADVAIIGAPVDMGVSYRPGARFGPRAIRQATYLGTPNTEMYHQEFKLHPFDILNVIDFGDANCPPSSLEISHKAIKAKIHESLDAGALPMVLGGDHSITLPSATSVAEHYGFGNVGMVHFDAHADTAEDSYGEVLISHSSPMRRLIESGAIPGKNFIQVGLRGYWPPKETFDWMREQGMRWHTMSDIESRGFDAVLNEAITQAQEGAEYTYLSVDIDVLDPAFAPGTGTPEPGGITTSQLLRAVRRIVTSVKLVAVDVVEVSPPYDGSGEITAHAAQRVIMESISALAWLHKQRTL